MAWHLLVLLLIQNGASTLDECPPPCSCTILETHGLIVNCTSRHLVTVPDLPVTTTKLYLQNNLMTTVPLGAFDQLFSLEEVDVSGNPWNCDCNILYLIDWLDSQPVQRNTANVLCASPNAASGKAFQNLTGNELSGCRSQWSIKCKSFFVRDLYMNGLAVVVLILMSYIVRMARKLACRVAISSQPRQKIATKESTKSE